MASFRQGLLVLALWLASSTTAARLAEAQVQIHPSASLDATALIDGEVRLSVDPLVFGIATLGWSVGIWTGKSLISDTDFFRVMGSLYRPPKNREYTFDLTARLYPSWGGIEESNRLLNLFLGGFVGWHKRATERVAPCPPGSLCAASFPSRGLVRSSAQGVEPGVEAGARFFPIPHLVIDLGGRARLIAFADPTERFTRGTIDLRLAVSVGVAW